MRAAYNKAEYAEQRRGRYRHGLMVDGWSVTDPETVNGARVYNTSLTREGWLETYMSTNRWFGRIRRRYNTPET